MNNAIQSLAQTVQTNCHISDARHASDYTLCIYLLKMREFYRWEHGLEFDQALDADKVGNWLSEREEEWDQLSESDFYPLPFANQEFAAFDANAINPHLLGEGYIYSAGFGPKTKPVFFLAKLKEQLAQGDYNIYISGAELARDLTSPIAMSQQNNIFIRRESLYRMIWEKTEEWGWHKNKNAMFQAMNFYPFTTKKEDALEQMTEQELNTLILHEIGEIESSQQLAGWRDMLSNLPRSQADIMLRAIKDLIADCQSTLPALINNRVDASVHFFFANFTHMRKELAPALVQAYQQWNKDNDYNRLLAEVNRNGEHWLALAERALAIHAESGDEAVAPIETLIRNSTL